MTTDLSFDGGRGMVRDEGRIGDWMQTWSGGRFYPADPRPEDIDLIDIAFALGNTSRYGGHCLFYSVAEHAVLVSHLVQGEDRKAGLHHDDPEVCGIADIVRPTKRSIGRDNAIFELERNVWMKAIAPKFGLPEELPQSVIDADTQIVVLEKDVLHPRSQEWHLPFPRPKLAIRCLPPEVAAVEFLRRHGELYRVDMTGAIYELRKRILEDRGRMRRKLIVDLAPEQCEEVECLD